jgi:hypothetical protein
VLQYEDGGGGDQDQHHQADDGRERAPQPAQSAACLVRAGGEELRLDVPGLPGVVRRPLRGDGQSGALEQQVGPPSRLRPGPGGLGDALVGADALAVGFDPAGQPGPCPQQRLVGDLQRFAAQGEQPGLGESLQDGCGVGVEVSARHAPSRVGALLPDLYELEHQPACRRPVLARQVEVGVFGGLGDGAADAAGAAVAGDGEAFADAVLPGGQQGVGQQGQCTGVATMAAGVEIVEEDVHQARLQVEPGQRGRFLDGLGELAPVHRAQRDGALLERGDQAGMGQTAADEVRPHREDGERQRAQHIETGCTLGRVLAEREELLHLVDDEQQPVTDGRRVAGADAGGEVPYGQSQRLGERPGQRVRRAGSGSDHHGAPRSAAQRTVCHRMHQARSQQGRLARAGRPDQHHGPSVFVRPGPPRSTSVAVALCRPKNQRASRSPKAASPR